MGCDGAGAHLSWSWTPCPAGTPHLIRSPRRTSASDSPTAAPQSKLWETRERERWAEIHGLKSVVLLWELAPRYDENPVVHHRTRDHEEPVVVHVSRRIHDLNLLWSGTQHNRVKEHQTVPSSKSDSKMDSDSLNIDEPTVLSSPSPSPSPCLSPSLFPSLLLLFCFFFLHFLLLFFPGITQIQWRPKWSEHD